MDRLKMHSPDLVAANIERLAELFPGCVTERQGADGTLQRAIDFDLLRQALSDHLVEGPQERYRLDWPGKREALLAANAPIAKTLRPCRDESVDFDTTQNLFIEGDNLDALKLLQETYLGKVKLIYIDPPYNTGRNLIYKNDYSTTLEQFLEDSSQVSSTGRLVANPETNGRFHSDWLSMIYARLRAAKNLLAEDGVLVCAIDENEVAGLSIVLKEIFGEDSYEHACVSVVHNPRGQQGKNVSWVNEFAIFVYPADGKKHLADVEKTEVDARNLRDSGTESDRTDAKTCFYPFIIQDEKIVGIGDVPPDDFHPGGSNSDNADGSISVWPMTDDGSEKKWRYSRSSVEKILPQLEVKRGRNSLQIIFNKTSGTMRTVWSGARYDASEYGTKLLDGLVMGAGFSFPKSLWTVFDTVKLATHNCHDALVLDFFAGSATTAHAVMELNAQDGGSRRFIMVQAPEECATDTAPYTAGLKTIADISKERIRQAGGHIREMADAEKDIGFRVLKVDTSNMAEVYYRPDELKQDDLLGQIDNIRPGRTAEDLLFQVLLDWGVDLALPIAREEIDGREVFFVDGNALAACFVADGSVDEAFVKQLAARQPLRVVFRDAGFASDNARVNVEQIFKTLSPSTEVRTL